MYGYLYVTVYPTVARYAGVTVEELDADMKQTFGIESKASLSKSEMSEYINFVKAYGTSIGCTINDPQLAGVSG